ncbi:MAG: hypothetical protein HY815_33430 [Candidatus Riflebacteria bacterium]|nr:hypothetical protein [Candidatus Riflebacteria bacterium]
MDRRQVALKLVLDGLGLSVDLGSFDDRLILQKAIYLAQEAGVDLGYYYRWYLRGPFCPAVAEDGFALLAGVGEATGWQLDSGSLKRLRRVRRLLPTTENKAQRAKKLELLASVHFLVRRGEIAGREPKEIGKALRRFDKQFTDQEVADALRELSAHEFLS